MGTTKGGAFDISEGMALELLCLPNPHGRPNSDILLPWINGLDVTGRSRNMWIIDFGIGMNETYVALYERPFDFITKNVKPIRDSNNRESYRRMWWQQVEARPALRQAIAPLPRFISTVAVSKHRLSVWGTSPTQPDHAAFVFARSDDYFFGVLHSRFHEVWALAQGTQLREKESGFRYTPTTCFETFPFPVANEEQKDVIGVVAKELNGLRKATERPHPNETLQRASTMACGLSRPSRCSRCYSLRLPA